MTYTKKLLIHFTMTTLLFVQVLCAYEDYPIAKNKNWVILPYAFSSDSTGLAGGVCVIKQGLLQPQTTMVASVFGGESLDITVNREEHEENFLGVFFLFLTISYLLPIDFSFHSSL